MTSLTRQEAEDRSRLLHVTRYEVHLDLSDLERGSTLRSSTTIRFGCHGPGASTFVEAVAEDLVEARLNGDELDPAAWDGERLCLSGLRADNVLEIVTTTTRTRERQGLHRAVDPADGQVYVWTTFEPDDARRVFACFDQPDLKAVFAFTVTAPAGWTVVSNSDPQTVEEADQSTRVWRFADTPPLSTYVAVVCAGPFVEVRRHQDGRELGVLARRSLEPQLREQADEFLDLTAEGLRFFGEHFGLPYPGSTYLQVFCPDYVGAMENYGCVVWTDELLFRATPTAADVALRERILLHEMAHMWFGDLVTMRWWDDLWLNESFAEWAAVWASHSLHPQTGALEAFIGSTAYGVLADRAPTTHPLYQPVRDVDAAQAAFDQVTYAKGAAVLRQLAAFVSQERFLAGLAEHFTAHLWGNATIDDLMEALDRASGGALAGWKDEWVLTAGVNGLNVRAETTAGGRYAQVTVEQQPPERSPALRRHQLALGVYDLSDGHLQRRDLLQLRVRGPLTGIDDLAGHRAADLLLLNEGHLSFADVRLDELSLATALAAGETLPSSDARALLRVLLWREVDAGALLPADVIRYALRALDGETSGVVRDGLLQMAVDGARRWASPTVRDRLCAEVAQFCLAQAATREGPDRRAVLKAASATALPDQLDALTAAVGDDVDLAWGALTRRCAWGQDVADVAQRLVARDSDPDAPSRAAAVAAAAPDAEAKRAAWRATVLDGTLPVTAWREAAAAFWQPHQDDLLRPYAQDFLRLLPRLWDRGMLATMATVGAFFPEYGVDEDYPRLAVAAAGAPDVPPLVAAQVALRADVLTRVLRARALG